MTRNLTHSISALGAIFFVGVSLSACGSSGVPADAVLKVGGTAVTKAEFSHWLTVAAASSATSTPGQTAPTPVVPDPPNYTNCIAHAQATAPKPAKGQAAPTAAQFKSQCVQQYTSLKQQVLGFLISSVNWILGEAADQGVSVTDAAVQKQFNQVKQQQFPKPADFQKFLASSGQTQADLLLRVKLNLLSAKIQQKVTKSKAAVSQAEIASYYDKNKQRFGQPERRDLLLILTKTLAAAQGAKRSIQGGKSFASVAKRVSIDTTSKAQGGSLPGVVQGQEQKALDSAVFAAKTGVLSGPVKTPFGFYVFEVKKITPASQQTLAQAQASVKQQLTAQKQQTALSTFVKGFQKKWTARTDCRPAYVVMNCKQYKAPKTPVLPAGAVPQQGGTATPQTGSSPTPSAGGSTTTK